MNPDRKAYRELEVQKRKAILMLSHQIIGQFVVENLYKKIWPLKLKLKKKILHPYTGGIYRWINKLFTRVFAL